MVDSSDLTLTVKKNNRFDSGDVKEIEIAGSQNETEQNGTKFYILFPISKAKYDFSIINSSCSYQTEPNEMHEILLLETKNCTVFFKFGNVFVPSETFKVTSLQAHQHSNYTQLSVKSLYLQTSDIQIDALVSKNTTSLLTGDQFNLTVKMKMPELSIDKLDVGLLLSYTLNR